VPTKKVVKTKSLYNHYMGGDMEQQKGRANANNRYETTCQIIQWQPNKQDQRNNQRERKITAAKPNQLPKNTETKNK